MMGPSSKGKDIRCSDVLHVAKAAHDVTGRRSKRRHVAQADDLFNLLACHVIEESVEESVEGDAVPMDAR
jgi:hypothetical protein